jgi:GNAT superfamily N-acetyltransferase
MVTEDGGIVSQFRINPPLPKTAGGSFVQVIELLLDGRPIGSARWFAGPELTQGIVQLLELEISTGHRRRGHGTRLLQAVIEQAGRHHQARGAVLRRVWMGVEQKSQVGGRAFLTDSGFHHVSTVSGLLHDQDLLCYIRSLD